MTCPFLIFFYNFLEFFKIFQEYEKPNLDKQATHTILWTNFDPQVVIHNLWQGSEYQRVKILR